jgi:hypothetical protein
VATKQVNIDILAKDKTAKAMQSATKGVNKLKDNVQQSVAHQQKSFSALGNTVRNVVTGIVAFQALRFSAEMVKMASSVEEMQSKSAVVFGKFVTDVRSQLEKFGDTVGRSTFELEGMASSIQDTFVPMGFARKEASKLSVQLTKLAVDVASFNNASDVETMMAFQSALVGNHETVRRFGVVITEATLKQELLRMGITKTADEITNAEKVQARLNLIIAGTADAQGDAERTNTSFANSMKALSAEFQEFMVEAINPMLPALANMVRSIKESIIETKEFLRSIGLLSELNKVIPIVEQLEKNQDKLAIANAKLAEETKLLNAIQNMTFLEKGKEAIKANGEFGLSIYQGEKAVKDRIEALKEEINQINAHKNSIIFDSEIREINTTKIKKQTDALKNLNEQKAKATDGTSLGIDASMGGVAPTFSQEERLTGLQELASLEMQIQEESFQNKYNKILEQDELLAELDRIRADEKIRLAHETAQKELEISKKLYDDNFNLIKNGKANEINLEKMSGKQMNELAKDTGRLALAEMAKHNKLAFQLNKAFAIKDAVISTAQGVSKALSMGPLGIPLAIAIGALGFAQVATIMSTKYQGRKQGGRMNQGQPYLVGEAGPELVVPDKASNVVPNGQLGNMGKQVTVNFNISTVDARGFNELLVNSRGTIVNMINNAVNEKGRVAII